MSSESKSKRAASASKCSAEGDHRKRRRNRTTQSCLNCHTSKRMCDRKRPACARCTQLGLTGLCVYEVDDPNQRSDSQDETARLLKRVAELEGVIRELKNKPHPRWSQSAKSPEDKWHSLTHLGITTEGRDILSDVASSRSSSENEGSPLIMSTRSLTVKPLNVYPSVPILTRHRSPSHSQNYGSPQSTPSPSLMTPTEEYNHPQVSIAAQPDISPDYDLSSMFLPYPSLTGSDNYGITKTSLADETCFIKQHGGHCGCLHESTNYTTVFNLSMHLRRAADILARSANHHIGSNCVLNQRISDLDTFTSNTLGNMITSHEDQTPAIQDRYRSHASILASNQICGPVPCRPSSKSIPSSNIHSWDMSLTDTGPSLSCDDSFMAWEPLRRMQ